MQTLHLTLMPSGRYIAYGGHADKCREWTLGAAEAAYAAAPFLIDKKCLDDVLLTAVRNGWSVLITGDN